MILKGVSQLINWKDWLMKNEPTPTLPEHSFYLQLTITLNSVRLGTLETFKILCYIMNSEVSHHETLVAVIQKTPVGVGGYSLVPYIIVL